MMEQAKPEYVLVDDVTGHGPFQRGPQTLKAIWYEKNENGNDVKQEFPFKVPYSPKSNCKKCHGRGYVGFVDDFENPRQIIVCKKCFPML